MNELKKSVKKNCKYRKKIDEMKENIRNAGIETMSIERNSEVIYEQRTKS